MGLERSIGFDILEKPLAQAVQGSIRQATTLGAILPGGHRSLDIFRAAVALAIKKIERSNGVSG